MTKKLTLSHIQEEVNTKKETFSLTINDEWEIDIQAVFDKQGIVRAGNNFTKIIQTVKFVASDEVLAPYLYISIIKEFTSLGEDIPDTVEGQTEVISQLAELDFLMPIIENLPKSEVQKVVKHIENVTKELNDALEKYEKFANKHSFKNKEVKNILGV
jgi:predicted RNA-binding protein with EMAP domain